MDKLTNENYFSQQNEFDYMSYSQFKNFIECEAQALAIAKGEFQKKSSTALKQGAYVDAYFSGELEKFKEDNPDMFTTRGEDKGKLKRDFQVCEDVIQAIEADEDFKSLFFSGEPQVIFTGTIADVPYKGKIDMLYPDKIVDMKCMADVKDVWDETNKRRVPFYLYYGYQIQAAIYQELVYQTTGKRLPYYLAVATKTDPVEKYAYAFSQDVLDEALELVKALSPRFQAIKQGKLVPNECGHCGYYHKNHKFNIFDIKEITKEDIQ